MDESSYYSVLGVSVESSIDEIRRAYRKLAMQWHPDRWARKNPYLLGEANRMFQKIQEAYSVLSDSRKREMYDAGFYDPNDDEYQDESFCDFMNEMLNLMAQVRAEEKTYNSIEELQTSLSELIKSFDQSTSQQWYSPSPAPVLAHMA